VRIVERSQRPIAENRWRRFLRFTPEILKPGSPLQRLHPVSVDRARERADPHPCMDKAPVSRVEWN
jgi:hypothetical protein